MKQIALVTIILVCQLVFCKANPSSSVETRLGTDGVMESIIAIQVNGTMKWVKLSFRGIAQPEEISGTKELFSNSKGSLFGFNLRQATKSNTAVIIRVGQNENIRIISDFNHRVKALYPNDAAINDYDLRITSIEGDICHIDSLSYGNSGVSRKSISLLIQCSPDGLIVFVPQ